MRAECAIESDDPALSDTSEETLIRRNSNEASSFDAVLCSVTLFVLIQWQNEAHIFFPCSFDSTNTMPFYFFAQHSPCYHNFWLDADT